MTQRLPDTLKASTGCDVHILLSGRPKSATERTKQARCGFSGHRESNLTCKLQRHYLSLHSFQVFLIVLFLGMSESLKIPCGHALTDSGTIWLDWPDADDPRNLEKTQKISKTVLTYKFCIYSMIIGVFLWTIGSHRLLNTLELLLIILFSANEWPYRFIIRIFGH